MDRISPVYEKPQVVQEKKVNRSDGGLFQSTLSSAMEKTNKTDTDETRAMGSLGEVRAPANINALRIGSQNPAGDIVGKTDNLITLLSNYAMELENPEKSLKEIEPLLMDIKSKANSLLKDTAGNTQGDDTLQRIAEESIVMANVELEKFNRGDYVA